MAGQSVRALTRHSLPPKHTPTRTFASPSPGGEPRLGRRTRTETKDRRDRFTGRQESSGSSNNHSSVDTRCGLQTVEDLWASARHCRKPPVMDDLPRWGGNTQARHTCHTNNNVGASRVTACVASLHFEGQHARAAAAQTPVPDAVSALQATRGGRGDSRSTIGLPLASTPSSRPTRTK